MGSLQFKMGIDVDYWVYRIWQILISSSTSIGSNSSTSPQHYGVTWAMIYCSDIEIFHTQIALVYHFIQVKEFWHT